MFSFFILMHGEFWRQSYNILKSANDTTSCSTLLWNCAQCDIQFYIQVLYWPPIYFRHSGGGGPEAGSVRELALRAVYYFTEVSNWNIKWGIRAHTFLSGHLSVWYLLYTTPTRLFEHVKDDTRGTRQIDTEIHKCYLMDVICSTNVLTVGLHLPDLFHIT